MGKVKAVICKKPVNFILIFLIIGLFQLNNHFLKAHTQGLLHEFLKCHLNDFMCPFWILGYSNFLLAFQKKEIRKLWAVLLFCLVTGVVWEYVAPFLKPTSVSDWRDLLCYIAGGLAYWCLIRVLEKARGYLYDRSKKD